jgi:long-chain acyl-CoA synthetase
MKSIYQQRPWLKYYPEGVPTDIEVPLISMPELFDKAVERWKGKTAAIYYGKKISYLEFKDQVDRFATALHDLGIRKGDTLAILLLNSPQYVIAYYGALKAGAKLTLISPMYVSSEIKHQLEDSGAKDIVCLNILYDAVQKSGAKLRNVILTDMGEYLPAMSRMLGKSVLSSVYQKMALPSPKIFESEGIYQLQDLLKKYPANPPKIEFDPKEDIATLQYTGGTTALPKAAMLTHYNYVANELQGHEFMKSFYREGKESTIAYMPFYHAAGQMSLTSGLYRGFLQIITPNTDLDELINFIQTYNVTYFVGAPTIFELLKDYEKTNRVNWKKFSYIGCGADSLLVDTHKGWERRTGRLLNEAYGMSEGVAVVANNPPSRIKVGSFGIPLPSTMLAIIDPEKDEFLPVGQVGEIAIIGPQIMKGYWNSAEANKDKFAEIDDEKWMRSGDLGSMDEEGYFHFYDRKRDMIKYKGHAVFAREVEDIIKDHPNVKEVGVLGVKDPISGEIVKAVVVLQGDARGRVTEDDIVKYCEGKLAHFKIPKIVVFKGEIPKTDVGKVSRRELREEDGE